MGGVIALVSAPSNLGLRPPVPTAVPGCAKAPEALRAAGLYAMFMDAGAVDAGVVLPGRYVDDAAPGRLRNQDAVVDHARRLAGRLGELLDAGRSPLVLGGDCSLLVGAALALARRGRHGLVHVDGHTDFRHPGTSQACASLAGEDLAAVVGLHWPAVSDIDGLAPYVDPGDAVHVGCRDDDEALAEVSGLLGGCVPASLLREQGAEAVAANTLARMSSPHLAGWWLHVDVDVLDPTVLAAVDSPDPGGLDGPELVDLLRRLAPHALGAQVTVFDPDLDPDGRYASLLAGLIAEGLRDLGAARRGHR